MTSYFLSPSMDSYSYNLKREWINNDFFIMKLRHIFPWVILMWYPKDTC